MEETVTGKDSEFALTAPVTAIARRSKPTLMQLGTRIVPSDGRWHPDLAAEYVETNSRERWLPVGELARVFYGGNTPSNKKRVRRRLYQVSRVLLARNILVVIEMDARSGAQACKLYDPRSEQERQYLQARLAKMRQQKILRTEGFEKAVYLAELLDAAVADPIAEASA